MHDQFPDMHMLDLMHNFIDVNAICAYITSRPLIEKDAHKYAKYTKYLKAGGASSNLPPVPKFTNRFDRFSNPN